MLALGTALAGFGYCLAGFSSGVMLLVAALFVGGLGASTQHPLASSLIAHAFAGARSLKALGTYNFAGDIGKMTLPAAAVAAVRGAALAARAACCSAASASWRRWQSFC